MNQYKVTRNSLSFLLFLLGLVACGEPQSNTAPTGETAEAVDMGSSSQYMTSTQQIADMSMMDMWIEGCPPEGPFGNEPEETAINITLYQCDGTPVSLNRLCGKTASYVYTYADWCPNCRRFASNGDANALYNQYKDHNFAMWFVITQKADTSLPDQQTCQSIQEQYQLEMTVLYDADGVTKSELGMRANTADMVLGEKNKIVINGPWAIFMVENALQQIYGF